MRPNREMKPPNRETMMLKLESWSGTAQMLCTIPAEEDVSRRGWWL